MRKPIIAANWKMNKKVEEAISYLEKFKELVKGSENEIIIFPNYICLRDCKDDISGSGIFLGAQNIYHEESGAFTGETSASMIKDYCDFVLVGHSERRHIFNENDESVNKKFMTALAKEIIPILCVGEKLEEREAGKTTEIVEKQIKEGLNGVKKSDNIVIAYEPVWAIGTGKTATKEQAQEVHKMIRSLIKELIGEEFSQKTRILYGGSVKPENIKELMSMEDIDGGLVGGASLDPIIFSKIVNF